MMRRLPILCALLLAGCGGDRGASPSAPDPARLDPIARRYVVLALELGHHDPNFVDAYYGPDSLKAAAGEKDQLTVNVYVDDDSSSCSGGNNLREGVAFPCAGSAHTLSL